MQLDAVYRADPPPTLIKHATSCHALLNNVAFERQSQSKARRMENKEWKMSRKHVEFLTSSIGFLNAKIQWPNHDGSALLCRHVKSPLLSELVPVNRPHPALVN